MADHLAEELNSQRSQFLDIWTNTAVELRKAKARIEELEAELLTGEED